MTWLYVECSFHKWPVFCLSPRDRTVMRGGYKREDDFFIHLKTAGSISHIGWWWSPSTNISWSLVTWYIIPLNSLGDARECFIQEQSCKLLLTLIARRGRGRRHGISMRMSSSCVLYAFEDDVTNIYCSYFYDVWIRFGLKFVSASVGNNSASYLPNSFSFLRHIRHWVEMLSWSGVIALHGMLRSLVGSWHSTSVHDHFILSALLLSTQVTNGYQVVNTIFNGHYVNAYNWSMSQGGGTSFPVIQNLTPSSPPSHPSKHENVSLPIVRIVFQLGLVGVEM